MPLPTPTFGHFATTLRPTLPTHGHSRSHSLRATPAHFGPLPPDTAPTSTHIGHTRPIPFPLPWNLLPTPSRPIRTLPMNRASTPSGAAPPPDNAVAFFCVPRFPAPPAPTDLSRRSIRNADSEPAALRLRASLGILRATALLITPRPSRSTAPTLFDSHHQDDPPLAPAAIYPRL
ncbi:hypothetical protein B0H14DRAFT_3554852 [Mycena olivaceomarginata]|nr:hypothetical protein B0H14DRAFT_3554852 [Mycena olivaceomarginata]